MEATAAVPEPARGPALVQGQVPASVLAQGQGQGPAQGPARGPAQGRVPENCLSDHPHPKLIRYRHKRSTMHT